IIMSKKPTDLTFESALERLESLIESMEKGDTPLAELVAKFEEGSKLLKHCQSKIKTAERKIQKLNIEDGTAEEFDDLQSES
ncbi:MAG: exodeoxyribonuclease VII small subunit, partial [Verrucomicrobiota bacterium]|nr:exodeoxyribonuclease VII small subunit [Verrucomicrobiota bacterium]